MGDLAIALCAKRYNHIPQNPTTNFAIPVSDSSCNDDRPSEDDNDVIPCHQLDVQVCPKETFDWMVFKKSWGDLWNILGTSIRPFGLTAKETGLYVRIPQIEEQNAKKSLLLLTRSPEETLGFLGLDKESYGDGFSSVEEMLRFACSSRFFRRERYVKDELKTSDRKRMEKRPLYRTFVEDYLAARPEVRCGDDASEGDDTQVGNANGVTRDSVLKEAIDIFDARLQYQTMMEEWKSKQQEDETWQKIAAAIPLEGDKLNLCIRGLKRWLVLDADGELSLRDEAVLDAFGGLERFTAKENGTEELLDWVRRNWEEVVKKEKARVGEAKRKRQASSDHFEVA